MKEKIITNKTFPYFLGITALLIAFCAAFFSVYGIGSLFAGAAFSAMIMAGSLEIGKIVGTTFLYRYWTKTVGLVKTYLTIAVIALMIITSAGIFGFLSAAYQKSSLTYKLNQEKIVAIELSKGFYTDLISSANERVSVLNETRKLQENRLSDAIKDPILTRNAIQLKQIQDQTIKLIDQANEDIKTENNKIEEARSKIQSIDEKVNEMKLSGIEKKDIQTFKFLADALGVDLDTVAKWFIISLIFVFDPLAIALILAYNVVIYRKEDDRVYGDDFKKPIDKQITKPTISTKPEIVELVDPKKENIEIIVPEVVEPPKTVIVEEPKTEIIQIENPIRHTNQDVVETEEPVVKEEIIPSVPKIETTSGVSTVNEPIINPSNKDKNPLISSQMSDYYKRMFKKYENNA